MHSPFAPITFDLDDRGSVVEHRVIRLSAGPQDQSHNSESGSVPKQELNTRLLVISRWRLVRQLWSITLWIRARMGVRHMGQSAFNGGIHRKSWFTSYSVTNIETLLFMANVFAHTGRPKKTYLKRFIHSLKTLYFVVDGCRCTVKEKACLICDKSTWRLLQRVTFALVHIIHYSHTNRHACTPTHNKTSLDMCFFSSGVFRNFSSLLPFWCCRVI